MIPELAAAIGRREPVVLATVVRTDRSVPRRAGAKMLIFADGRIEGTVGGGEMEHRVKTAALEVLAEGSPRMLSYALVDPNRGDPGVCGGEAEIYLEPYMPSPTLYIVGAGHVGQAVHHLATWLGLDAVVWDDRAEIVDELPLDQEQAAFSGPITEMLSSRPPSETSVFVIVTRNVALDLEILPHVLATPARYVGLMGSERRWSRTRTALVDAGIGESDLDRVRSPIGVEIAAETPEEIAVSVLAEVVSELRGP